MVLFKENQVKEIAVDYEFSDADLQTLKQALTGIEASPYLYPDFFDRQIASLIENKSVPTSFIEFCEARRDLDTFEHPYIFLKNCPVDDDLPFLDYNDPVQDKRTRKRTFVAEGFLMLYGKLMGQQAYGYANICDGDIFMDVHPSKALESTQSMKSIVPLGFHKDAANHFVRPDWVNLFGLRSSPVNRIMTAFVRNKDLIDALGEDVCRLLRQPRYHTPHDVISTYQSKVEIGDGEIHPILGGSTPNEMRFFENRTKGRDEEAEQAVNLLAKTLHELKTAVFIGKGDFLGAANNDCLHNREHAKIVDQEALKNRWLMKTVTLSRPEALMHHFVQGRFFVVNG
jgi:hypothetical protein